MKANKFIARFIKTIDNLDQNNIKVPGLILSHAGFGKTSTVQKYCEYMDYNLITLIPSMYSSDDILGLQSVQNNKLIRLTPSWFNKMKKTIKNGKRTILFIDEITTCDPYIQGPLLDLIFNGNLGEEHLPNNIFIIAAGNYTKDLNNVFKMSDPLINRFVLLNLSKDDFDIEELLNFDFNNVSKNDLRNFLEIESEKETINDFNLLKNWILEEKEIDFGKTNSEELENIGLIGFTSIRSLDNSLKFVKNYMENYNDDLWIRVMGDTLGTSERREGSPLRYIIKVAKNYFRKEIKEGNNKDVDASFILKSLLDNIKKINNEVPFPERKSKLMNDLSSVKILIEENISRLTELEISQIKSLANTCIKLSDNDIRTIGYDILEKIDKALDSFLA